MRWLGRSDFSKFLKLPVELGSYYGTYYPNFDHRTAQCDHLRQFSCDLNGLLGIRRSCFFRLLERGLNLQWLEPTFQGLFRRVDREIQLEKEGKAGKGEGEKERKGKCITARRDHDIEITIIYTCIPEGCLQKRGREGEKGSIVLPALSLFKVKPFDFSLSHNP